MENKTKFKTKKKVQLLSPAGSFTTLQAALNAGCDSVYFGIADFNMRASAAVNFTMEDLPEVMRRCHEVNVTAFVTVNTVMYDEDLPKMRSVVDAVKAAGGDAVIVADMAALIYANSVGMAAHISTQMSVSNIDAVKFYSKYTDRIVLARELSISQVKKLVIEIKEQKIVGPSGKLIEIEVFAHGALCVAVSGRCGMSLYATGSSANKGRCSNVCRRRYKAVDIDTGVELEIDNNYIMSASDLNTIGMLDKLVDAGVTCLKIEGRGRGPEYVDVVIRTYREALESIESGTYNEDNITKWREALGTVYNRGFSKGLYMGRSFDEWSGVAGSKATLEKKFIGNVKNFYKNIGVVVVEIMVEDSVKKGDRFAITGPTSGIINGIMGNMKIEELVVSEAKKGEQISFVIEGRVRKGDEFYVMRERVEDN